MRQFHNVNNFLNNKEEGVDRLVNNNLPTRLGFVKGTEPYWFRSYKNSIQTKEIN